MRYIIFCNRKRCQKCHLSSISLHIFVLLLLLEDVFPNYVPFHFYYFLLPLKLDSNKQNRLDFNYEVGGTSKFTIVYPNL